MLFFFSHISDKIVFINVSIFLLVKNKVPKTIT